MAYQRPHKKRRLDDNERQASSRYRSISPPPIGQAKFIPQPISNAQSNPRDREFDVKIVSSPLRLNNVDGLSSRGNIDAVTLPELLGDNLIQEVWLFNFLFDVDFIMNQFHADVQSKVHVKIVHGSWKDRDANRARIIDGVKRYDHLESITAYMPEPFGSHHSKMMMIFRSDFTAQIVIHTANMVPADWLLMSQAVWLSPRLPLDLASSLANKAGSREAIDTGSLGPGERFKRDILNYLNTYGSRRTGLLVSKLQSFDFSSIRAAFISSVPTRVSLKKAYLEQVSPVLFGWPALRHILSGIPVYPPAEASRSFCESKSPMIVAQVSSIASLGKSWTDHFTHVLSTCYPVGEQTLPQAIHRIVFPTPDEVRRSVGGYRSGGSIHLKLQSKSQRSQVEYLRPMLAKWAGDGAQDVSDAATIKQAYRRRASPHIKTYIRFSDTSMSRVDWAMITSANLSTQAWGAMVKDDEVRISSYETGVIIWPDLFAESPGNSAMVPCFGHDMPTEEQCTLFTSKKLANSGSEEKSRRYAFNITGLRMPYDAPLVSYGPNEDPWCASMDYDEPDWSGVIWKHSMT